jgi:hypothetical protein
MDAVEKPKVVKTAEKVEKEVKPKVVKGSQEAKDKMALVRSKRKSTSTKASV